MWCTRGQIFSFLEESELLRVLAQWEKDELGRDTQAFYMHLRVEKTPDKYEILNICLMVYATRLERENVKKQELTQARNKKHKRAIKTLQPSTMSTYFKQLFARFHQYGILFNMLDFKNTRAGSFTVVVSNRIGEACEEIDDYARAPNRSFYNPDKDRKLREDAKPAWDLNNYEDLLYLTVWQVLTYFMLRGSQEVSFSLHEKKKTFCANFFLANFSTPRWFRSSAD